MLKKIRTQGGIKLAENRPLYMGTIVNLALMRSIHFCSGSLLVRVCQSINYTSCVASALKFTAEYA